MKFSYNWLREMVPTLAESPKELGRLITIHTAECEGVEAWGELLEHVDAARVLSVESLGETHNRKAIVETKRYGTKTVVCGAPNCRPGITTIYVPAGVTLPNGKAIGKITLEGVESDGMLASGAELGINNDHSGVVEIDGEAQLAADFVIEIDNKSLTHRPDLWGHYGMAREVAAIAGRALRDPVDLARLPKAAAPIKVTIEEFKLCPRYSALVFENVKIGPSPLWLQQRMQAVGLNPINNIVDVTNLVLAELPQPMHAFDADKLRGGEIIVRPARDGETLAALNGECYTLDATNLVIADKESAVAVAGVIGGADSAIGDSTTRIVLESANFHAIGIRKTSVKLKLRTDASMRFEKSQDPENTLRGLARAIELLELVCPGIRLVGGVTDEYQPQPAPPKIDLPLDWLDRKLGCAVPAPEVRRILESLAFGVEEPAARTLRVTVPSWRATKDISIADDLVEEIGRMIGYGTIDPAPPLVAAKPPVANPERAFQHTVREMAAAQGFTEVYNYSFVNEELIRPFGFDLAAHVEVTNPIAADQTHLRTSLLPRVWRNMNDNARHLDHFRLFEIGREIHKSPTGLPNERPHFVAAIYARDNGEAALRELTRLVDCLLKGAEIVPGVELKMYEHPHRNADVKAQGESIGRLFELHPTLMDSGRAAILDLDMEALERLQPKAHKYQPLRRYPTSAFDLSPHAPSRELVGSIGEHIRSHAGADLVALEFLRTFALEEKQSVSFRITVGAPDRTLSSEEVGAIRMRIAEGLRTAGYELKV